MKIIASDYDGTLKRGAQIIPIDKAAIKTWQSQGNLFGIATGRGITSLTEDMYKGLLNDNPINFDFYICNTGATIYDKNKNLIFEKQVDGKILLELLPIIIENGGHYIGIVKDKIRYNVAFSENEKKDNEFWFTKEEIFALVKDKFSYFHQIDTCFSDEPKAAALCEKINEIFKNDISAFHNNVCVDIPPVGVCKSSGIYEYLNIINAKKEDVIAVGDNFNDVDMLLEFESYTFKSARTEIQAITKKAYTDFAELITEQLNAIPNKMETNRLVLRRFNLSDAEALKNIAGDYEIYKTTAALPHPYTKNHAVSWINTHEELFIRNINYIYAIEEKDKKTLCGCINLTHNKQHESGEVGFFISKCFWNKGYASEALAMIIKIAFEKLSYNRIYGKCFDFNKSSAKVMLKNKMIHEGTERESYFKEGIFRDILNFGITKSMYNKFKNENSVQ